MPEPTARTCLSFAASDVTLGEGGSQTDSEIAFQADEAFKLPHESASVSQIRELASMRVQLLQQMDEQGKESRRKEDAVKQLMEQQKEESKKREEEGKKREEEGKKREEESKKREDALERKLDQMMSIVAKSPR
ncbi:hypothetical protein B0A54_17519 [Friedmanniomyces endolithicus]|uniref:Uncharacterized protein n=1 Tax=Friedmanniomyces endolithicus TaxID=329885 RepID=A0A4U0TVZ6_9PEZI|nr:hypothetical protein B0A54_17519 [Friedmanniomyces endolithicus]